MKVSSIIKTPVKATQFNSGTASVRAENGSGVIVASTMTHEFGHAIAHAINSHDPLVDMVRRLRSKLIVLQWSARDESEGETDVCPECGGTPVKSHEHGGHYGMCGIGKSIREADELLKGEDG